MAQAAGTVAPTQQTTAVSAPPAPVAAVTEASQPFFFALSMLAFILIIALVLVGTRKMKLIPRGTQNFVEWMFELLFGIPEMVMGPRGRQYGPLIATFFLYILFMNLTGLIPFLKSGTASLSITLGLAIFAFLTVQYYGFKTHGLRYLAHFLGPVPAMAFLILPLELISEFVRIASLSVRLYGNISGEEQVTLALSTQLHPLAAVVLLPLQILTVFLQAFVFSLLVTVYISLATEKHDEEHSAPAEAGAH
jgi:F-type H+-transporting ATPase subunit a